MSKHEIMLEIKAWIIDIILGFITAFNIIKATEITDLFGKIIHTSTGIIILIIAIVRLKRLVNKNDNNTNNNEEVS